MVSLFPVVTRHVHKTTNTLTRRTTTITTTTITTKRETTTKTETTTTETTTIALLVASPTHIRRARSVG